VSDGCGCAGDLARSGDRDIPVGLIGTVTTEFLKGFQCGEVARVEVGPVEVGPAAGVPTGRFPPELTYPRLRQLRQFVDGRSGDLAPVGCVPEVRPAFGVE
jgi:hypothetical protein